MKKVFTSISMALCFVASSFTTSAQTVQLSEAQKTEIQKEVLPVVFEQIKEQTGLDILGWAQPQLSSDFIGSLPVLNNLQSGLRADTPTPYSVKPDSVVINMKAINTGISLLTGDIKVDFEGYTTRTIPMVGDMLLGRPLTIDVPGKIQVISSKMGEVAEITIDVTGEDGQLVPFDMDMAISLLGKGAKPLLSFSFVQNPATSLLEATVDIQEGMYSIWGLVKGMLQLPELPQLDYKITVNLSSIFTGELPMILYGIPESGESKEFPMGGAVIALDFSKTIPVSYINVTSYENAQANKWSKYTFIQEQVASGMTVAIEDHTAIEGNWEQLKYNGAFIIRMSDSKSTVADIKTAAQTVIERVVSELAATGEASIYTMSIVKSVDSNSDGVRDNNDREVPVMDIEVTPSISGTNAIADINIKSFKQEDANAVVDTEMNLKATADLAGSEIIKIEVMQGDVTLGSAYFTSNIAGIVTSNDDITINTVKVTPVDGGIYIDNSEKATYRIVNMSGATIANGTVSGDNAYISTSSLAKGVYVIVVTENGVSQSVKFAR
ncbi:MAG: T9SS type A sorting domain-containing protein [Parabacteroides merdae]|nr:T9SS type A sorting domain-containing protein [Parabacteroides merdae]